MTHRAKGLSVLLTSLTFLVSACDDDTSGPETVPDVSGSWSGSYRVSSCLPSNARDPLFCGELFVAGSSLPIDLALAQSGAELEGAIAQGQVLGDVVGTVDENGVVVLSGVIGGPPEETTTTILSWQTGLAGDTLLGSWRFRIVDNADLGFGTATVDASMKLFASSLLLFDGCPAEGTLTLGGSIAGRLTFGDCELSTDGSFLDVYALSVAAGDSVSITVRSTSFNAYLLFADEDEVLVFEDDDSGGGPNGTDAELILTFEISGTFLVAANSSQAGEIGPYTVTATRLGRFASVARTDRLRDVSVAGRNVALEVGRAKLSGGDDPDGLPRAARKLATRLRWSLKR